MRNRATALLLSLAFLSCWGCDEKGSGASGGSGSSVQEGARGLVASAPPPYEPPSTWSYSPAPDAPARSDSLRDAVGPAPAGKDAGRALFDGDSRSPGPPGASGPSGGSPSGGGKAPPPYTAGPRKDTLSIAEPPPPGSDPAAGAGGERLAARKDPAGPGGAGDPGGGSGKGPGSAVPASRVSAGEGGCPEGMAAVGTSCVDRYEGALVELADGSETPWSPYKTPAPGRRYKAVSRAGLVPQGYISGAQAKAACGEAGKRLCRAGEWLQACKGPAGTAYPYGPEYESRACNEHDRDPGYSSPIVRLFGKDLKWDHKQMNDPRINQQENGLAAAGAHASCTNGYGVFDMVGNLHEWIEDGAGTFQGGYYVDTYRNGRGCAYRTTAHPFTYHDYSTGFRCCADPSS